MFFVVFSSTKEFAFIFRQEFNLPKMISCSRISFFTKGAGFKSIKRLSLLVSQTKRKFRGQLSSFNLSGSSSQDVVFVLKQIVIRLKECEVDVVINKKNTSVPLCSRVKVINGFGSASITTQFYLHPDDTTLNIQLLLSLGKEKKMGGEVKLTVTDWEPNVLHNNISQLLNSPDKQGRLAFAFYYFPDEEVVDTRPIFLANDRHSLLYEHIRKQKDRLASETFKLGQLKTAEEHRRFTLQESRRKMQQDRLKRQALQKESMEKEQDIIQDTNNRHNMSKAMLQKLTELMNQNGIEMKREE